MIITKNRLKKEIDKAVEQKFDLLFRYIQSKGAVSEDWETDWAEIQVGFFKYLLEYLATHDDIEECYAYEFYQKWQMELNRVRKEQKC